MLRIVERAHAAADGEGNRQPLGDPPNEPDERVPPLHRGLDVEEHELVGARIRVGGPELDGIADVPQPGEVDALDDAPGRDVEAGDQTRERHSARNRAPAAPLFSGWNWTPTNGP